MLAIEAHGLSKRFATGSWFRRRRLISAVRDVDLQVAPGEIHGLLGPNGAGKSTLVRMLCGLVTPDSGGARVAGVALDDPRGLSRVAGFAAGGERGLYPRLTGRQHLAFFASLRGLRGAEAGRRIGAVLATAGLTDAADRATQTYSSGMRQRLAIATALLHQPPVLFLDEPARGLDPIARAELHALLRGQLAASGAAIVLVTHDLQEAESVCHRLTVLVDGRVAGVGEPRELRGTGSLAAAYRRLVERC